MTKKLKKSLATLLAMSMILSMMSTAAFANEPENEELETQPTVCEICVQDPCICEKDEGEPQVCETCGKVLAECEGHEEQADLADTSEENEEEEEEQPEENLCEHEWNEGEAVEGGTKYTCALCGESHVLENEDNSFGTDTLEENGIVPQAGISGEMTGAALLGKAVDGVITLDGDVTLTSKMGVNKDIVLDLNGHTVTATGNSYFNTIEVYSGKTLTIRDSVGGGKITDSGLTGSGFGNVGLIYSSGTLNLKGGTLESVKADCVFVNGGTTTLDGAALVCSASMKSGINLYQNGTGTAMINSGSITADKYGLNIGNKRSATMNGGTVTVTGVQGVGVFKNGQGGDVKLLGGTINATGVQGNGVHINGESNVTLSNIEISAPKYNGVFLNGAKTKVEISGDTQITASRAINMNNSWWDSEDSSLTITDGNLNGNLGTQRRDPQANISISGGTFTADVTPYVAEGKAQDANGQVLPADEVDVPMGSVAEVDGRGYTTLQAAIDAAGEGDTVTLLTDVKAQLPNNFGYAYEPVFAIEKSFTLDGAGHKITVDTANWSKYDSKITGHIFNVGVQDGHVAQAESLVVNVTIKNLTIVGNAEYMRNGINAYTIRTGEAANTAKTTLNLENVNISGCGAASLEVNNSTVNVKNCDLANGGWQQAISVDKGTTNLTVESGTIGNIVFGGNGTKNNASITGGRIAGVFAEAGSDEKQNIAISGGTFDTAVLPAYCAEGYVPVENNDGTYTVNEAVAAIGDVKYGTLQAAIGAVTEENQTVELLADIEVESALTVSGTVTIDGNGFTLNRKSDGTAGSFKTQHRVDDTPQDFRTFTTTGTIGFSMFTVAENGSLTLNNVKVDEGVVWTLDEAYELDTCTGPRATKPLIALGKNAKLDLTGCEIKGIHAACGGGIISASGATSSVTSIADTSITGCVGNSSGLVYCGASTTNVAVNLNNGAKIEGNYNYNSSNHAMFQIYNGTTMTMENGSSVSDNYHHGNGGAIGLYGAGSKLIMNGGKVNGNRFVSYIKDNGRGAPIYGHKDSTIIMNGGEVCDNVGWSDTGLDLAGGSGPVEVKLNGGTVSGNTLARPNTTAYALCFDRMTAEGTVDYEIGEGMTVEGNVYFYGIAGGNIVNNATINGNVVFGGTTELVNNATINGEVRFSGASTSTLVNHGTVTGPIRFYEKGKDCTVISDIRLTNLLKHSSLRDYVFVETANADGTFTYFLALPEADKTITVTLPATASVTTGSTTTLAAAVENAPEGYMVKWTSSDESIATVQNGVVTGVSAGTATITATVGAGSATCDVTVRAPYVPPYVPPVTEPDEDLGDEDTPLSERPWLFVDVKEGDYFYDAVKRLFDKNVVGGTTDTTYEPYTDATRGMVAQILYGMAGSPDVTGLEMPFSDVSESDFYYKAVLWGYANKVLGGYPEDNTFRGENTITREELAALLHQYGVEKLGLADTKGDLSGFIDAAEISDWAVEHMKWAVGMEIMHGDDAKKLMPVDNTIRADMTIMLNNLDMKVSDEK